MMTAIGFLSLPIELICYILILLTPRDVSRCAMTCKFFSGVVWNSVDIQYKLELYAHGLISTEIATMDSFGISSKMRSLKKLASLWRSDFHANTVFETAFATANTFVLWSLKYPPPIQSVKCGLWWGKMRDFLIRDCNTNPKLSRTWSMDDLFPQPWLPGFFTFDPLQDLMAVFPCPDNFTVTDTEQDHCVFLVEFRLASSQRPHPSAGCASFECKHTFDAPGDYCAHFQKEPEICGDRVFVFYYIMIADTDCDTLSSGMFIQVIDWRRGRASDHFFRLPGCLIDIRVVDEQKIVVVSSESSESSECSMSLYTLQGLDGSPQCRITYRLPKSSHPHTFFPQTYIHAPISFHGTAARPELMPHYVPSLESQIMVLEDICSAGSVILVIDMVIFSDLALHSESEMPIVIPWSDWGPQHTHCFPHHESHQISVFGSKMAYALPQECTPEPGQRLGELSDEDYFYVHIWDFNKRATARSESLDDPDSPDSCIRKPGRVTQTCFVEDTIFSNRAYTAVVCHTPFSAFGSSILLEQDRLTVTWAQPGMFDIQVISPVPTEGGTDLYPPSLPAEECAPVKRRRASKRVQRRRKRK